MRIVPCTGVDFEFSIFNLKTCLIQILWTFMFWISLNEFMAKLGLTNMKSVDSLSVWNERAAVGRCESPDRIVDWPPFFANMWWIDYFSMDYYRHPEDRMTEFWCHWMPIQFHHTSWSGFLIADTCRPTFDANDRTLDRGQLLYYHPLRLGVLQILHLDHGTLQLASDITILLEK